MSALTLRVVGRTLFGAEPTGEAGAIRRMLAVGREFATRRMWQTFKPPRGRGGRGRRLPRAGEVGGGPRVCVGNNFALTEAQMVLAAVAQRYRLRLIDDQAIEPDPTVALRPHTPIVATPERTSRS